MIITSYFIENLYFSTSSQIVVIFRFLCFASSFSFFIAVLDMSIQVTSKPSFASFKDVPLSPQPISRTVPFLRCFFMSFIVYLSTSNRNL